MIVDLYDDELNGKHAEEVKKEDSEPEEVGVPLINPCQICMEEAEEPSYTDCECEKKLICCKECIHCWTVVDKMECPLCGVLVEEDKIIKVPEI